MKKQWLKLFKIFISKVNNKVLTSLSLLLGKNLTKPESIYFLVTNKCNFKCEMCPQWSEGEKEDPSNYLSTDEMRLVVDQAAKWGVKNLGISGGETLIYKDKVFNVLKHANDQKINTHFVTNGWLLTEEVIKKYDQIGGGYISLSIDAANDKHDQLRGTPGAFKHVKMAIAAFNSVKPKKVLLKINLVVSNKNVNEIINVVKLTKDINSSIFIQPYDPYNWHNRKSLDWKEYHENYPMWVSEGNYKKLDAVIHELIKIKKKNPSLILNSLDHLAAMPAYFSLKLKSKKCFNAYRSFVISPFGTVSVCKYGQVGDVKKERIKDIWHNEKYNSIRKVSLDCDFNCLLGCMYDPSIFSWLKAGLHYLIKK